ncbi:STN and carboxypeptidase regulatory-like domain-containing protein [Larkinella soli]|uniref:STN and carboxypeptidase regulatory-like domain-containing protein n=1 Tax=Larkinella soli TaxID=1770527 RepID=UPI000FFB2F58|nr:STN and carboxypeptidase regulatory-like domain-containing protein [Larkinella soli]
MYPFRIVTLLVIIASTVFSARAQSSSNDRPPLERIISVDLRNERLGNALKIISREGRFNFSYNSDIINENSPVTLRVDRTPVREVLTQLFRNAISFRSRGNHIILQRAEAPEEAPKSFILDGYIIDRQTGQRVSQVSIYEKTTLASTVSNPYGYYRIKLSTDIPTVRLEVRRKYYFPETVAIPNRQTHTLRILLTPSPLQPDLQPMAVRRSVDTTRPAPIVPQPMAVAVPVDSVPEPKTGPTLWDRSKSVVEETSADFADWFKSTKQAIHDANLAGDTLHRYVQFSLFPFVGTNHTLSGRVINEYSFNLVAGYSLGVRSVELGGFLNMVRGDVEGVQAAGFANIVGENTKGVQAAGFINGVRGNVVGIQAAGFGNTVIGTVRGIQGAGFYNMTLSDMPNSVQAAGFGNIAVRSLSGFQLAGFSNFTGSDMNGFQLAGFGNITGGNISGFQLSGFSNLAIKRLSGWQISGFLNYAGEVERGHQIAIINIAGASETTPIGLLSYVQRNGYRRLEISTDELMTANLTFKTGVRRFYNIFTGGSNLGIAGKPLWSLGYGFGTAFNLGRTWMWNIDLTGHVLSAPDRFYWDELSSTVRLSTAIEKKLGGRLALAFGPAVSLFISDFTQNKPSTRFDVPIFRKTDAYFNTFYSGWVGFHAALRITNKN